MGKRDLTPQQAQDEIFSRFLTEEYLTFLTKKIVRLQGKRLTYKNLISEDEKLFKEFNRVLVPGGILARVRRRLKRL